MDFVTLLDQSQDGELLCIFLRAQFHTANGGIAWPIEGNRGFLSEFPDRNPI